MRTRTHTKAAGTDAGADFMSQVSRKHEELQFYDSTTVKVEQNTRGVKFHVRFPPAASKGISDDSYKGIYVPGQTYDALEWVVVQSGSASGAYISTADDNTNAPITGINWVQFSALPQWF